MFSQLALIVMIPAIAVFTAMAIVTLRRADEGAAWSLGIYLAFTALGIAGASLQILANDATTLAMAKSMMFMCRAAIPVALFVMVLEMMGKAVSGRTILVLCAVPLATMLLALSNAGHGLVWDSQLLGVGGQLVIHPAWGPWYRFVHAPYSYLLLTWMIVSFFLRVPAVSAPQRPVMISFLVISALPMLTSLLHSMSIVTSRVWLPAFSITVVSPIFFWVLRDLRQQRFRPVSYRELMEQIKDPVIGLDQVGRIVSVNGEAGALLGKASAELLGSTLPSDSSFAKKLLAVESGSGPIQHQGRYFDVRSSRIEAGNGDLRGRTIICRDVTAEFEAQEQVRVSEKLMRTMIDQSSNGIIRLRRVAGQAQHDHEYACVVANVAVADLIGEQPDKLGGMDARMLFARLLADWSAEECDELVEYLLVAVSSGRSIDKELQVRAKPQPKWWRLFAGPVDDDVLITLIDITQTMQRQLATQRQAALDPLTGLLNRSGFMTAAEEMLNQQRNGVLLFIDLNGFKGVNDDLGHQVGDSVLQQVAMRLNHCCRPDDIVGRLGGDEFVVMAGHLSIEHCDGLAHRVVETLSQPYQIEQRQVDCAAAVGQALFPRDGDTIESLIGMADSAMYRAKRRGANTSGTPEPSVLLEESKPRQ